MSVRVVLGTVSYKGPHRDCFDSHYEFMHYLGKLQERSQWLDTIGDCGINFASLPKLNPAKSDGLSELRLDDPQFEFFMASETGCSLVGLARDRIVERCLEFNADYLLFFDDDMIFGRDTFLRLWRHQKPIVGALAFTAREPIAPVLWKFKRGWDFQKQRETVDLDVMWDYPKDQLVQVDSIGTGVVLIQTDCFRKVPKPWFNGSVGAGEDVHWCWQLHKAGIPIFCDTSVKTIHMPNAPTHVMDEEYYLKSRAQTPIDLKEVAQYV